MKNSYKSLTENMQKFLMDIVVSLGQLPIEQKGYIFGYEGEEDFDLIHAVACYIALEYIKYSYDFTDPQYSLRTFLKDPDDDSERMRQQRIMQYVMRYKKREIDIKGVESALNDRFANINMAHIGNRIKGYRITSMNYFEHQNIHNLEIIKAIVEKRIVSSKKVSNTRFQEIFEQYDGFVKSLIERSKLSDKDMVFASLALFTFEWHYPIEMFYYLACIMEEEGIDTVDQKSLSLLCGYVKIESCFGGWFSTESRMIKERLVVLPLLFGKDTAEKSRDDLKDLIKEILVLGVEYKEMIEINEDSLFKDWFRKESSMADWASFFRYYDIFSIWQKKEWTSKRIQIMRYLFDISMRNRKHPENRS